MSLKHGLLGILNYAPMTGYDLDRAFKASLHFFWRANTSQVYRELNTMEERGWLTSEWVIQNEKPNKRVYSITKEGEKELHSWLKMSESDIADAMSVRSAFLMQVFFAGEKGPEHSIEMLKAFRQACLESAELMKEAHESVEYYGELVNHDDRMKYWEITALYGDEFYRAGLRWADKAIALLEEMKK